jgi:hypothetical protein
VAAISVSKSRKHAMGKVACALALPGSVKANGDGEADIEIPPEVVRLSQVGILGLESLVFVVFVVRAQSRLSRGGAADALRLISHLNWWRGHPVNYPGSIEL